MKKIFRYVVVWAAISAVIIFNCTAAYAYEYHDLRNDDLELFLPDSWVCDEIDKEDSEGLSYELIAESYDDSDDGKLAMDLYYMSDVVDSLEYFHIYEDESEAFEYYNKYGRTAIETLYADVDWSRSANIGEPTYYEGTYDSYLIVPVNGIDEEGDAFSDMVYLTCEMRYEDEENSIVHKILMFYNLDGTAIASDDMETAEEIADEFYDYGYGEEGFFDEDYGGDSEVFSIIMGLIGVLVPILAAVSAVVVAVRKKLSEIKKGYKTASKKKPESNQWKTSKKVQKKAHDHVGDIVRKNQIDRSDGKKSSNSEERYMESLRTLRKSGLLTKEEMQDMLERHERNNSYRRSK